jgi:hypothetical protein
MLVACYRTPRTIESVREYNRAFDELPSEQFDRILDSTRAVQRLINGSMSPALVALLQSIQFRPATVCEMARLGALHLS